MAEAVNKGETTTLKKLFREFGRSHINAPLLPNYATALSYAALKGKSEVVRLLIRMKASTARTPR